MEVSPNVTGLEAWGGRDGSLSNRDSLGLWYRGFLVLLTAYGAEVFTGAL